MLYILYRMTWVSEHVYPNVAVFATIKTNIAEQGGRLTTLYLFVSGIPFWKNIVGSGCVHFKPFKPRRFPLKHLQLSPTRRNLTSRRAVTLMLHQFSSPAQLLIHAPSCLTFASPISTNLFNSSPVQRSPRRCLAPPSRRSPTLMEYCDIDLARCHSRNHFLQAATATGAAPAPSVFGKLS